MEEHLYVAEIPAELLTVMQKPNNVVSNLEVGSNE